MIIKDDNTNLLSRWHSWIIFPNLLFFLEKSTFNDEKLNVINFTLKIVELQDKEEKQQQSFYNLFGHMTSFYVGHIHKYKLLL